MEPLVSIVIPNFNRADLIGQTLESLLNQSFKNWEALVIDDGSTDDSENEVRKYSIKDGRVFFDKRQAEAKGAPSCRNIGLRKAKGEYVIFLDSDDLLASYCLEQRVQFMTNNPDLDFSVFPGLIFSEVVGDSRTLINEFNSKDDILRFLDQDTPWLVFNPIWKKKSLNRFELWWDETLLSFQDYDFNLQALIKGLKYQKVQAKPDCFWRRHSGETISKSNNAIDKVKSLSKLIFKIFLLLKEKEILNPLYKNSIVTSYLDLVHRSLDLNAGEEAKNIWKVAFANGIITRRLYLEGLSYIYLRQKNISPSVKMYDKVIMKIFYLYWGREKFQKNYGGFLRSTYQGDII